MPIDNSSRRSFLKSSLAGSAAFQIVKPELVRGAGDEKLKAGLVGCGARGTQAVENLLTGCDNVELVAHGRRLRGPPGGFPPQIAGASSRSWPPASRWTRNTASSASTLTRR